MKTSTLGKVELTTPSGEVVRLGELWRDQTAVFVFVRHFG